MPELIEQMYCSQQIVIPPKFPYILKRYCKAAIKTQPYDLLRWSYEYFKALAQHRPPPVKLRLEYPVYSTEGGLTRGCLKVLANQLSSMDEVPLPVLKTAWHGFCLDSQELKRILCLCKVYLRKDTVPFLHFIAVAGGFLTKSLTHTMILLCESLTKEPDGGSAAIPVQDFLTMYKFLAPIDASKDTKYFNGYKEGETPPAESLSGEEEITASWSGVPEEVISDDFWEDTQDLQRLTLINDNVARSARLSVKLNMPIVGKIERSPSIERAGQIERENYLRERKGRVMPNEEVEKKLREMSAAKFQSQEVPKEDVQKFKEPEKKELEICVFNEEGEEIPYEIYGEIDLEVSEEGEEESPEEAAPAGTEEKEEEVKEEESVENEKDKITLYVAECYQARADRLEDLEQTFDEIAAIVNRFKSANYDLGMVAGRQMSTTSGEFIVQHIEKEIMAYIDEQIAILPDPDLKKKKAKPEEVAMIREILENFLDENMDVIVPEIEEVEEEEQPIPEITVVYAVPGIGGPVDEDIVKEFTDYALDVCKVQADVFMPRNIRHFLCPPMEKYIENEYEDDLKKEEVPTGGVITD
ncbi:uncharacterized protein LOC119190987 [Manduca sexta]|uniref:uncharacterized protein LOC119190987 n=1 Tax=Manduca sexta TaxID=7130 RepID=UPI00188DDB68|nr:uncharacterized protein LOC119190987 [Manduca sexta]